MIFKFDNIMGYITIRHDDTMWVIISKGCSEGGELIDNWLVLPDSISNRTVGRQYKKVRFLK
jgi:hypothetical protein